jgi:hypothetical protein
MPPGWSDDEEDGYDEYAAMEAIEKEALARRAQSQIQTQLENQGRQQSLHVPQQQSQHQQQPPQQQQQHSYPPTSSISRSYGEVKIDDEDDLDAIEALERQALAQRAARQQAAYNSGSADPNTGTADPHTHRGGGGFPQPPTYGGGAAGSRSVGGYPSAPVSTGGENRPPQAPPARSIYGQTSHDKSQGQSHPYRQFHAEVNFENTENIIGGMQQEQKNLADADGLKLPVLGALDPSRVKRPLTEISLNNLMNVASTPPSQVYNTSPSMKMKIHSSQTTTTQTHSGNHKLRRTDADTVNNVLHKGSVSLQSISSPQRTKMHKDPAQQRMHGLPTTYNSHGSECLASPLRNKSLHQTAADAAANLEGLSQVHLSVGDTAHGTIEPTAPALAPIECLRLVALEVREDPYQRARDIICFLPAQKPTAGADSTNGAGSAGGVQLHHQRGGKQGGSSSKDSQSYSAIGSQIYTVRVLGDW